MAWNNGFPATYTPIYQPYGQQTQFYPQMPQQNMSPTSMSGTNPQMLTPPTIRAEIVQVEDEKAASEFPVGAGASQMMIAKDDSAIFIKSALQNGQTTLDVFEKRPPAPPAPAFDPGEYVRKDELETLVSAALAAQTAAHAAPRRVAKKEEE